MSLLSRNCPTVTWLLEIEIFFFFSLDSLIDMEMDVGGLTSNICTYKREEEGQLEEPAQIPGYKRAGALLSPRQDRPRMGNTCPADATMGFPGLSQLILMWEISPPFLSFYLLHHVLLQGKASFAWLLRVFFCLCYLTQLASD